MSSLLFVGDTVWPAPDCIDFEAILPLLKGKQVVVNLEGPILERPPGECQVNNRYKTSLSSHPQILQAMQRLGVVACDLANNHINDYCASVDPTIRQLTHSGIEHFGTEERPWIEIESNGSRYILIGACSPLPERKAFAGDSNPKLFRPRELLRQVSSLRSANPDAKIVCVVHWGYELMLYPEPADREWAHRAIEAGADFVIGHHPHVVQGVEAVGRGFVAYSLGNFLMPHGVFNGARVGFAAPEVLTQLGVELIGERARLHWFRYDKSTSRLVVPSGDDGFDGEAMIRQLTPFAGMSHEAYRAWFSRVGVKGHLTRHRGGPVYGGYFGMRAIASAATDRYMLLKRQLRKVLMGLGLHTPRAS